MSDCPGCQLPEPADWCWNGRFDCPIDKPPRYLDVWELWRQVRALKQRVATLEQRELGTKGVMADDWEYTPSCPCDRCEDERAKEGMTMVFGLGPRPPAEDRPHRGFG